MDLGDLTKVVLLKQTYNAANKITQTDNIASNTHRKDRYHVDVRVEKNRWEFWILSLPSHQKYWFIWFALYIQDTAKCQKQNIAKNS